MENGLPLTITIDHQFGSGGAFIGQKLARELNILYANREIIRQTAAQFSVLEEEVESREEKINTFWESFLKIATAYTPSVYVPPGALILNDSELFKVESEIIEHISKEHSAVIIGRCGSYILRNHKKHVSIFLHADIEFRKRRVQEMYNVDEGTASKMIAKNDSERERYYETFAGKRWMEANKFDITISTSKLGLSRSVELLLEYLYRNRNV